LADGPWRALQQGQRESGRAGAGRAFGLSPFQEDIFSEFISNATNNSRKCRNCFKGTKNTRKITKIPGKLLEIDLDMHNPHKTFGAREKDFKAF
jgi:hypothetical protein